MYSDFQSSYTTSRGYCLFLCHRLACKSNSPIYDFTVPLKHCAILTLGHLAGSLYGLSLVEGIMVSITSHSICF